MYKLKYINQLLEKAMQDNDSKRVQELRDKLPRAYNDALEAEPLLQKNIHYEYSRLDRAYFDYCEVFSSSTNCKVEKHLGVINNNPISNNPSTICIHKP